MKKLLSTLMLAVVLATGPAICVTQTGCTATQQRIAYNTLYSIEVTVDAAYSGFNDLAVAGKVTPTQFGQVAKMYQKYQAAFRLALSAAQFNKNAIATTDVVQAANDLVILISTIK